MNTKHLSLRTKLIAAFVGLAAISLLVIGVALYTTLRWQAANAEVETHFQRSLLLQSVRANTFQALKEVDDGLTSDHVDARADFEAALQPANRDFATWAAFAHTDAERDEVSRVRAAYTQLINSGRRVFDLIPTDRQAAIRLADDEVDTKDLARFRQITVAAVNADMSIREDIARDTRRLRETAQVMLTISAVSVIALMLLIAAYLTSDLFKPLRSIAGVLDRLAKGQRDVRADDARSDEIGDIARAVNSVAGVMDEPTVLAGAWDQPTGTTSAVARALQARLAELRPAGSDGAWRAVERMSAALAAAAAAAPRASHDPLDLAALLYAAVAPYRAEIDRRGISVEQRLSAPTPRAFGDASAVASSLEAMLARALDRLPNSGGRLALRAYVDPDNGATQIEVADNGSSADEFDDEGTRLIELAAERHGAAVRIFADLQRGSVAQLTLPS